MLALRIVAEAYGGFGAVAAEAGVNRESSHRALSPKGNPTLKTSLAVRKTVGMRLSVEPERHVRVGFQIERRYFPPVESGGLLGKRSKRAV